MFLSVAKHQAQGYPHNKLLVYEKIKIVYVLQVFGDTHAHTTLDQHFRKVWMALLQIHNVKKL